MSEIRYVNELGDALERAIVPALARPRLRLPRRPWRLVAVLVVLALGGEATAAALLDDSTQLAATSISCLAGTDNSANGSYDIQTAGRTPAQACAAVLDRPADTLVTCVGARAGVVVFESDGSANQCGSLGMSGLPATYAAADAHVHELVLGLARLYGSQDCIAPPRLVREVDALLGRLHFVGWHAQVETGPTVSAAGPCGQFPGTGSSMSDPAAAIDSHAYPLGAHDLVMIETGPARPALAALSTLIPELDSDSASRCFAVSSLQAFVTARVAARGLRVAFTTSRLPAGTTIGDARGPRYEAGCAIVGNVAAAPDGRSIAVALADRSGPAPSTGASPATEPTGPPRTAPATSSR
jgi:hypothetical protein